MKQAASESFARPRRIIDLALQDFVQIIDLPSAVWHPLAGIPAGVKFSGTEDGFRALGRWQLRVENRATDFQVRIERFTGDEEPHDFARTLEDRAHATITQKSFHRDRLFAASGQRLRRLIAATDTYEHRLIRISPRHFCGP